MKQIHLSIEIIFTISGHEYGALLSFPSSFLIISSPYSLVPSHEENNFLDHFLSLVPSHEQNNRLKFLIVSLLRSEE